MHRFLLRFAYKVAAHTTTGSFGTEQKVKAAGVVLAGCRFIPNGVDEKIFHFDQVPREDFFMTVGEIKPRKGADLGVKALALLAEEFPALTYKIVGSYKENPFVDTIRALAKEAGVSDRVVFTGRIDDRELVSLYNRCRAFVLAARDAAGSFEGFPMVYYEANRCGAPVITTTGFGSEYAIKPGVNGFLVDPEDAPAIADALRRILTDKNLAQQLTQGALNESGKHTWGQLAPSIVAFYNDAKAGITT
jgi:phosphatidylinositol alpha-1,6-mannosyltransferase